MRKSLVESTSRLVRHLEKRNDILLLTTSTRYRKDTWDVPKTTQLARRVRDHLKQRKRRVTLLDVAKLKIYTCEGNVSGGRGNRCARLAAKLRDRSKNPTGHHRESFPARGSCLGGQMSIHSGGVVRVGPN